MITVNTGEYVLEYPEEVVFAFSPVIIRIQRIEVINLTFAAVKIYKDGELRWNELREVARDGQIVFDVSRYLQMLLSSIEHSYIDYSKRVSYNPNFTKNVRIEVLIYTDEEVTESTKYEAMHVINFKPVWGCLDINEKLGGHATRTWFVNYPFTFDLSSKTNNYFDVYIDGKHDDQVFNISTDQDGVNPNTFHPYLVNPGKLFEPPQRELYLSAYGCLHICNGVVSTGVTSYKLRVDRSTSGVYLRWIDRQGQYCYYLFKSGTETIKTNKDRTYIREEMIYPDRYTDNGLHKGDGNRIVKSAEASVVLIAPLVDSDTFDFLTSLLSSPVVDRFISSEGDAVRWQRVNISAGTVSKSAKKLQDFTATIELPNQNQQQL